LTRQVATDGQALIATEGRNNTVEYWSVDEFGNAETPHKTLINVELDKTAPFGSIQINNQANYTRSIYVTLTLTADDVLSGVKQVRFSNDGVWDNETWETLTSTKNWTLTLGDGMKTVYYQIMDNAGLTASYSASVMLDTTTPSVNAGQNQTVKAGNPVNFTPNECQDDVGISSTVWNFGDGTDAIGMTTTHAYSTPGIYTVTLTVQDLAGNTATSNVTVTVQSSMSSNSGTIPEFPSVMFILPLMLVVTLVSLIIRRKSFVKNKKRTVCFS
jgi:PKD repeat protein